MGSLASRLWPCLAAALLAAGAIGVRAAEARRLGGVDYIDLVEFCGRFGLEANVNEKAHTVTCKSRWTTLEFEIDSRENHVNGLRVFFGDPIRSYRGHYWISKIDAETLLEPILRPGMNQRRIPDLKTIAIDPGHGGSDPGKENKRVGVTEKAVTLDTSLRLAKLLERAGYKVVLTRRDDRQLADSKVDDLVERAAIARKAGADLFISLHYNSVESGADRVTGVEVFTLTPQHQYSTSDSTHEDDDGARTRAPANRYDHWNTMAGYAMDRAMHERLGTADRGLKRARFKVLVVAPCPALLVEAGYLSNDTEARKIATPAYRQQIAEAIESGIAGYASLLDTLRAKR
jgi:N-acetylmuramoyl-L-alanine amidase